MAEQSKARRAGAAAVLLRRVHATLLLAHRACLRRHRLTIALFLGAAAAILASAPPLTSMLRINEALKPGSELYERERTLDREFPSENPVTVVFHAKSAEGFSAPDLCRIEAAAGAAFSRDKEVTEVFSALDLRRAHAGSGPFPVLSYPRVLELNCGQEDDVVRGGALIKPLLASPWANLVVDADGRDFLVQFKFRDTIGGSRFGRFDPKPVGLLHQNLRAAFPADDPRIDFWLTGGTGFLWYQQENVKHDQWLNLFCMGVMVALFYLLFGTLRGGVLMVFVNALMAIYLFGSMALAGTPLDTVSKNLFIIIAVAGVQDFVFLAHDQRQTGRPWRTSFRSLLVPAFFTSLTTAVGFGSLCISDLAIIQRFGAWATAGSLIEWVTVFFLLPCIFKEFPYWRRFVAPRRLFQLKFLPAFAARPPRRWVVGVMLGVFFASFAGVTALHPNDSFERIFLPEHPFAAGMRHLSTTHGWEAPVDLVFRDAAAAAPNQKILAELRAQPEVKTVDDPYGFLRFVSDPAPPDGMRQLVLDELRSSGVAKAYFSDAGKARAILYLKDARVQAVTAFTERVEKICGRACFVAGDMATFARFWDELLETLVESFVVSLVLVLALLTFLNRALGANASIAVFLSSIWGPIVMIGVFALFKVDINFTTSIFASVLVGISGDNAVQFMFAARRRKLAHGVESRAEGAVFVTMFMICMMATFYLSSFRGPRTFATIFLLGLAACLAGDVWLLNGLLNFRRPLAAGKGR